MKRGGRESGDGEGQGVPPGRADAPEAPSSPSVKGRLAVAAANPTALESADIMLDGLRALAEKQERRIRALEAELYRLDAQLLEERIKCGWAERARKAEAEVKRLKEASR